MANLLYLTDKKLNLHYKKLYHFDYFRKYNNVNVINICDFLPEFYKLSLFEIVLKFQKIREIQSKINKINPSHIFLKVSDLNYKIVIIKWLILIFTKEFKIIVEANQLLPPLKGSTKKYNFLEIKKKFTSFLNNIFLLCITKEFFYLKIKTSKSKRNNLTEILAPSRDGDKFLENNSLTIERKKIIFLDEMFVDHPDFIYESKDNKISEFIKASKSNYSYYEEIRLMLGKISKQKNLPIIICAHPKHNIEDARKKFQYPISELETIREVAKADLVIAHSSMSINFAILLKKPILLYKSIAHIYSDYHNNLLEAFQRELDLKVFDKNSLDMNFTQINIDDKKYQSYIQNYIIPRGIKKTSYEILQSYLKE